MKKLIMWFKKFNKKSVTNNTYTTMELHGQVVDVDVDSFQPVEMD